MSGLTLSTLDNFKNKYKEIPEKEAQIVFEICKNLILTLEGLPWSPNADMWMKIKK